MMLPPPADILPAIYTSCSAVSLPLNETAIDRFIRSVDRDQWSKLSSNHGVRLPLKFDSAQQELNLLATLGLLNFLSGYRKALHRLTTRGAYSTVLSIVLSAYLSASDDDSSSILSAQGMKSCSVASIAALAQITTHTESDHPTLGSAVKVGTKDAEAFEMLELVVKVLHETGETLQQLDAKNLGEWFENELCRTSGDSGAMIHSMATTFPAFNDTQDAEGKPVYLFKKALWTLNAIHARFSPATTGEGSAPSFPVPQGVDRFPVFADNVLPSMLIHYDIFEGSPSTTHPTVLRASAVHACHRIVGRAHELSTQQDERANGGGGWWAEWSEVRLDGYLWSLAKEGSRRRDIERVVEERGTVHY